jgi:hypothetical protein
MVKWRKYCSPVSSPKTPSLQHVRPAGLDQGLRRPTTPERTTHEMDAAPVDANCFFAAEIIRI